MKSSSTDPHSIKNIKFNKKEENKKQQESIEKVKEQMIQKLVNSAFYENNIFKIIIKKE